MHVGQSAILRTSLGALWAFTLYQSGAILLYEVHAKAEADLIPGRQVSVWDSRQLELTSWSTDPVGFRWALDHHASLGFSQHEFFKANESCSFEFDLVQDFVLQNVSVQLNGSPLGHFQARAAGPYSLTFPCRMLRSGRNRVDLEFPNAATPHSVNPALSDERVLGIGLQSFCLQAKKN